MKRELKDGSRFWGCSDSRIARRIPMKRELKGDRATSGTFLERTIARRIPMKRELKDVAMAGGGTASKIARRIPMKRELKGGYFSRKTKR